MRHSTVKKKSIVQGCGCTCACVCVNDGEGAGAKKQPHWPLAGIFSNYVGLQVHHKNLRVLGAEEALRIRVCMPKFTDI